MVRYGTVRYGTDIWVVLLLPNKGALINKVKEKIRERKKTQRRLLRCNEFSSFQVSTQTYRPDRKL